MEKTTKEQIEKLEKSPLLESLEKLSKKNPKLKKKFIKKQFVSNQKVISKEFKTQMGYYFDSIKNKTEVSIKDKTEVTSEVQIELHRKLRNDDALQQIIRLLHPNPSKRPKIIDLNEDEIFGMIPQKPTMAEIKSLMTATKLESTL